MDFEQFLQFLSANGFNFAVELLSVIFGLVILIIQVKKYNLFKKDQAKESEELKYRTASYREKVKSPSQTFDTEVSQYRINKASGELEELPDKLDIQQLVQSAEQQALPNMLQHLEPPTSETEQTIDVHNEMLDQLDILREADEYRLSLCAKYELDPRMSFGKVLDYLKEQEALQRGKVEALTKIQKGGVENAQAQVDTTKSEKV